MGREELERAAILLGENRRMSWGNAGSIEKENRVGEATSTQQTAAQALSVTLWASLPEGDLHVEKVGEGLG